MKKLYKKTGLSLTAIMLVSFALITVLIYACKKPTDGINVLVDSQELSPAPTLISFVNADSTSVNQPADFIANITGPGASLVQMVSGGTTFQVSHGILSLSLIKGTIPTVSNPVIFTVTGQAPGFAPFIENVTITQDAPSLYVVKALDYTTSAAGTTLLNANTILTNGATLAGTTLTTPKNGTVTENATLVFAAGTQVQDANKNTINTAGNLTSNIVQLNASNNALTEDFPGGLYAPDALDQNGTAIVGGVNFVPAGLLSITMNANGTAVKNFSKPVNVSIELSSTMINFLTGVAIKVSDVIPYWSQNDLTGEWKYEGNATVALDASNKLSITMPVSHLSTWMCGWFWAATSTPGAAYTACGGSLTVNLATDATFKGGNYAVYLLSAYGNIVAEKKGGDLHNGSTVTFKNLPNIPQAKIAVYYKGKSAVVSALFGTCAAGTVNITVPTTAVAFADPVNVAVNISGLCNGKQISVLPSAPFMLYQQVAGGTAYQPVGIINIDNGIANVQLDNNAIYYMATYYNKTFYQTGNFQVLKADIAVTGAIGSGFNIKTNYNAAANTISLTGTIPVPCN